ncbi:hypothetical protein NC651_037303 [Populus alba x Populus x berolinensis]|nr:hypothetical protein NC651_037303 [Populus alba x Populus x berolinensis]
MEFWQKTRLIPFSFMSLSEFDFLCCYDPHTNEENMRSLFPEQNKYACYTTAFRAESKLTDQMKIFNA